jgi:hypothetical protein
VGRACTEASVDVLLEQVNGLFSDLEWDDGLSERCRALSWRRFSVESAARQVVCALEGRA